MTFDEIIAKNLRHIREQRGLLKTELAELSGVTRVTINNIELGTRKGCNIITLNKLAKALGISIFDLLEGVDESE